MGRPLSLRLNFSGLGANREYVPVPVLGGVSSHHLFSLRPMKRTDPVDALRFLEFPAQDLDIDILHAALQATHFPLRMYWMKWYERLQTLSSES